uniref:ENTH domain-containing protein n=1 Tax=Caenorhabditis tropicalis TaxID=1561998 RepID=A0A1I7URM9_9PELO
MSDLLAGLTTTIKSTANAISRNEYVRKVTESMNDAVMNYPKTIMDVREATNEDPWGPTGPQMKKIAEYTRSRYMEDFYNVYTPLFSRMLENNKDAWRRVYKSLVLLDYLLKNGSERFVQEAREKTYELRRLESYKYIDDKGKDQGINIRHRVKQILEMMNDDELLQAERKKANSDDKSKYRGYDQYDIKMGASSFKSSSSSSKFDDSWDRGGSSSNTTSKRYDDDYKNKEVSNFSFSSTTNRSPSPELGFVDDTSKKDDDDGFGDFVSSRSSQPAAKAKSTPNASKSFFDDAVPAIPPPSGAQGYVAPPLSPVAKSGSSNVDLLFDVSSPAPAAAAPQSQIDLFAQLAPAPAPTTAPSAGGMDLFDFGAAPVAQPTMVSPVASQQPASNGAFNGFDFGSSFGSGGAPLQPMCNKPQQPAPQVNLGGPSPKVGNSFAGLDQFMSLSLGSTGSNAPKAKTLNQMKRNQ